MKRTARHVIVQILQTKDEENICIVMDKEMAPYHQVRDNSNYSGFF